MSATVELAKQLISRPSLTPNDAGCQELMIAYLQALGFFIERMRFGEVDNFWARLGTTKPLFVFAGHTDVVPTGPLAQWKYPPFSATVKDGLLHGRGAADMKGSLAAMLTATERFVKATPNFSGSIGFLITSDEEGPSVDGTVKVVEVLEKRQEKIDYCLVGEPSCHEHFGDVVKNGRRGSLNGIMTVKGIQGHVAYPQLADNPIHNALPALSKLAHETWDNGNEFFPATSFQISNINSGTGADNVIPGQCDLLFNFRYSTESNADTLKQRVSALLDQYKLKYTISWRHSGLPFLTNRGVLTDVVSAAVSAITGVTTQLSTAGGTSDGRFIAPTGAQVVELGPLNRTIHKIDEQVACADLDKLSLIYETILKKLLPLGSESNGT